MAKATLLAIMFATVLGGQPYVNVNPSA